jgi:hypothetical protein
MSINVDTTHTFCLIWVLLELFRTMLMYCTRALSDSCSFYGAVLRSRISIVLA